MSDRPTPAQFRAARALLGWSMMSLAEAARISVSAVVKAEGCNSQKLSAGREREIRAALETAGVRFIDDDGEGAGVRLRSR